MRATKICAALAAAVVLAGCGGSSKPKGYLEPANLEDAIRTQVNDALNGSNDEALQELRDAGAEPGSDRVDQVVCILNPNSKREFTCKVSLAPSGYTDSTTILVSKDGDRYVAE